MSAGRFVIEIVLVHDAAVSVSVGERYVVPHRFYFYFYPAWEGEGSTIRSRGMMTPGKGIKGSIGNRGWSYSRYGIGARLITGSDSCGDSARGVERWRSFRGCSVCRFLLKRPRGWVVGGIGARTVRCRCRQMLELRLTRLVDRSVDARVYS
jgi:hypothetical protein